MFTAAQMHVDVGGTESDLQLFKRHLFHRLVLQRPFISETRVQTSLGILLDPLFNELAVVFAEHVSEITVKRVAEEEHARKNKFLKKHDEYNLDI